MTVRDVLAKMVDNYMDIVVEVFSKVSHLAKERYFIEPHKLPDIPDEVLDTKVEAMVLHYSRLCISVLEKG